MTKCIPFIFIMQVIPLCAHKSWHIVMPIVQWGHCCSPATGSFCSEKQHCTCPAPSQDFHLGCALFNFFCSTVIFTIPLTLCYKWLYTEPFCGGEMYASKWQASVNYRIDGGMRTLSVAALSPLNAREQIENGSIDADAHDVLCIKLDIYSCRSEIEDTHTRTHYTGGFSLWFKALRISSLCCISSFIWLIWLGFPQPAGSWA